MFGKQTLRELSKDHEADKRTLKQEVEAYQPPTKEHLPRRVFVIADALYFGERKEATSWCAVAFRDLARKEDLWWSFEKTETTGVYRRGRDFLEEVGYDIAGVTGDGFAGLREGFSGIPFQMCHVHMERIIIEGTTLKPELEAGQALLALAGLLHTTDSVTFKTYVHKYFEKYRAFLNQKSENPTTGERFLTHEPLHKAAFSLARFLPYLFTFEQERGMPKTTNSLEGHFSHIRDIVEIHCGLSREHKEKVLHSIFLAGSIAPKKKKLDEIL